ncbi:MAG TPA: sigma-70 family RNA polymerase sigma factor [Candidatus Hydrogenedentes bacterium]|nr:sigma-70 family RNA polymerase sigma factor [Candidatus Hydrogenedentota bacterium]
MVSRNRPRRVMVPLSPEIMKGFDTTRSLWYETQEEIEAGLAWREGKAALLRWLCRQMRRRLTLRERRCLELYFFKNMNYREVAAVTGTNPSSVLRGVQRAMRKLRQAAAESPPRSRHVLRCRAERPARAGDDEDSCN